MAKQISFTMKQARNYAGLTQKEVSKLMGITPKTYIGYEHGRVPIQVDKAKEFSKIVNMNSDRIIFLQTN